MVVSPWKRAVIGVLVAPLLLLGIATIAWAIDTRASDRAVARGVELAGTDIGGFDRDRLVREVDRLTSQMPATAVRIETDDIALDTTAGDLGVSVDADRTIDAALSIGHRDPGPLGPLRWVKSAVFGRPLTLALAVDRARAEATIERLEGDRRTDVVEPSLDARVEGVALKPGRPGRALSIDKVLAELPGNITSISEPIEVRTERITTAPTLLDAEVAALAKRATDVTASALEVKATDASTSLDSKQLRPGFSVTNDGGRPALRLDPALVVKLLSTASPAAANPTGVKFDIVGGTPIPVAGHDARVCCGENAPDQVVQALLDGRKSVEVTARTMTAAEGVTWANGLGVKEITGQFTTKHPCCQPRVTNIHRISDLARGALIAPGVTFSVNDYIGRRTKEKGFVSAPVIDEGKFSEDFGGGVSQFGTTTFNAAFFAGLDIPEHKAHSIYISRYPFGREATLAYPSVDLKIRNTTPYGVVIWPSYTGTSLTVQMWSTKFAVGAQTGSNKTSGCGPVKITRTRTYVADGHTSKDWFTANYNCNPPKHP